MRRCPGAGCTLLTEHIKRSAEQDQSNPNERGLDDHGRQLCWDKSNARRGHASKGFSFHCVLSLKRVTAVSWRVAFLAFWLFTGGSGYEAPRTGLFAWRRQGTCLLTISSGCHHYIVRQDLLPAMQPSSSKLYWVSLSDRRYIALKSLLL